MLKPIPRLLASLVVLGLVVAAGIYLVRSSRRSSPTSAIGDNVSVIVFTNSNVPNGRGLISVPMVKTVGSATILTSYNGKDTELPVTVRSNGRINVPIRTDATSTSAEVRIRITANGNSDERTISAKVEQHELGSLVDLAGVTKPELSMKGVASAEEPEQPTLAESSDDITQRPAECAPTGAADSIIGLAKAHGEGGKLPANPMDLVDQLKGEMRWTPGDGVVPEDFIAGKTRIAAKLGLPIRTEQIGSNDGKTTFEQLEQVIAKGGAAELRIRFTAPGKTKVTGGHLVTVVNASTVNGEQYIDVHDPATPEGTETYRVDGNAIPDYAVFGGDTYLGIGFAQYWEPVTGTSLDPMTDAELRGIENAVGQAHRTIKVIVTNGHKIPMEQVHIGKGPECTEGEEQMPHYHANNSQYGIDLDGNKVRDPGGCGFGMAIHTPVEDAVVN